MVIMGILNHFSLKLVNVGIIHQKLDEIVGKINNKEIVGKINNSIFNFFVTALLDYRKRNVPKNLKYAGLHVLAPFQLKEVSNILSDPGFEIIISILE